MSSSRSYNDIPEKRRIAIAQQIKEEEKWSSSDEEDEPKKTVGKIKKLQPPRIIQKSIPGDTSNSAQESKRQLEKLERKMEELISLVQSMSKRNKQVEHVLCQVAEKTNVRHNLRSA